MKLLGIAILVFFYTVYIGKMLLQRRKGIQTDQIAKGRQRDRTFYIEFVLKIATYTVVAAEAVSIVCVKSKMPWAVMVAGSIIAIVGDLIFAVAVVTMKDSWRAGIAEDDKTEMITDGIYQISRNPAFLGFDCVYVGLTLMFFNLPLLLCSVFAMLMLHLQILQEEQYLVKEFGDNYVAYKTKVCRYIGRKVGIS